MVSISSRKREEDEMLRYAYVERSVEKHYAFRYKGFVSEVPYMFLRDCLDKRVRDFCKEIEFREMSESFIAKQIKKSDNWRRIIEKTFPSVQPQLCRDGDWIVVTNNKTAILSDEIFRLLYKPVIDLTY